MSAARDIPLLINEAPQTHELPNPASPESNANLPNAQRIAVVETTEAQPEKVAAPAEWDKVRELALSHLERFISLEPKVLRGDKPDAVHDMRVASRRLQQVLDLLYPAPRPREISNIRRKIRKCRRTLSDVRNCDVLVRRVDRLLASKRVSRRESWTEVSGYLHQRRAQSFEKALCRLSRINLAVLYVHLKGHLAQEGLARTTGQQMAGEAAEPLAPRDFYARIGESLGRVSGAFEEKVAESQRDPKAPIIHGARVAAKRLRYMVEIAHAFKVPGSAERLTWLRALQTHLGNWHDLEVLEQLMIEMVARPEYLSEHLEQAMDIQKLIVKNRRAKKDYEEKYFLMTNNSDEFRATKDWMTYLVESPSEAFAKA